MLFRSHEQDIAADKIKGIENAFAENGGVFPEVVAQYGGHVAENENAAHRQGNGPDAAHSEFFMQHGHEHFINTTLDFSMAFLLVVRFLYPGFVWDLWWDKIGFFITFSNLSINSSQS